MILDKQDPASPEITEKQDRLVIRFGSSELTQTKDQLAGRVAEAAEPAREDAALRRP